MEHYRPNGKLAPGYFCSNCGAPCGMMGHAFGQTEMNYSCIANRELVRQLEAANREKPHFVYGAENE